MLERWRTRAGGAAIRLGAQLQSHHGEDRGKIGGGKGDKGYGGGHEGRRSEDKVLDLQR